jgi:hypothetical protein
MYGVSLSGAARASFRLVLSAERPAPGEIKRANSTYKCESFWQLRAASATSLNQPMAGYEAAQQLLATGAADSADPNLQHLLAQLKNKGWLDKQNAEKLYEQQRYILVAFLGEAEDKPNNIYLRAKLVHDMTALLLDKYPARQILYTIPASDDPPPILTMTINVHDSALSPCNYSMVKNVWKCPAQTAPAVAASAPQGWKFDKTYTFTGGTSGLGWGVPRTPLQRRPAQFVDQPESDGSVQRHTGY